MIDLIKSARSRFVWEQLLSWVDRQGKPVAISQLADKKP